MQILEEFKAVGGSTGIKSVATYGGISRTTQLPAMARGAFDVLIATPGRLIDYICSEDVQVRIFASWQSFLIDSCADCPEPLQLKRVTYLVIDEADRMINEGFEVSTLAPPKFSPPETHSLTSTPPLLDRPSWMRSCPAFARTVKSSCERRETRGPSACHP